MSYLTTSLDGLKTEVIAALEGEGFAYNPLTTSFSRYLATALGEPNAYLTKSVARMLAEINAQYGGSLSHLTSSVAQLMDDCAANIGAGGGGPPEEDDDMPLIDSGIISTNYLDIELPTGYDLFKLTFPLLRVDVADYIAFAFSPDGGSTFYFDPTGGVNLYKIAFEKFESGSPFQAEGGGQYGYFGHTFADGEPSRDALGGICMEALIYPGSANLYAGVGVVGQIMHPHKSGWFQASNTLILDTDNENDLKGRQNVIRIFGVGNADSMTASTTSLLPGSWFLRGELTPS